jgi:hypothetical protein
MKRLAMILGTGASLLLLSACASHGTYGDYYGSGGYGGGYGYGSFYGGTSPTYRYDGHRDYSGNRPRSNHYDYRR